MLKKSHFKSFFILIPLLLFSFSNLFATDFSVEITDVQAPKSVWEDKPISATCNYRILLNSDPNRHIPEEKVVFGIIFKEEYKKFNDPMFRNVYNDKNISKGDSPYKEITVEIPGGKLENKLQKGKFERKFFPGKPGKYTLSCKIDNKSPTPPIKQTNSINDIASTVVEVYGLYHLDSYSMPIPEIIKPAGNKLEITNLTPYVVLEGKEVKGLCNFDYPKKTVVFEEGWNFTLLRKNGDQFDEIASYSGLIENSDCLFTAKIPKETLNTMNDGEYRIESWLNQDKTPYGNVVGEKTYKDFILSKTYIDIEKANEKDTNNLESTNKTVNKINTSKGKGFVRPEKTGVSKTPATQQNPPSKFRRPESATNKPINNSVNALIKNTDLLYWTNLWGMDYKNFYADQWKVCKDACDNENNCKSWTWLKKGVTGPHARCFLKNGVPEKKSDQCCISGIKN